MEGLDRPIINARIENCKKSDTFRESWERRRCVIPAAFYYEWSRVQSGGMIKPQDQYAIQPRGATATWFAGLYRIEEGHMGFKYPVFTILTRPATPELKKIYERMPVMMEADDIDIWIRPGKVINSIKAITDLVAEKV